MAGRGAGAWRLAGRSAGSFRQTCAEEVCSKACGGKSEVWCSGGSSSSSSSASPRFCCWLPGWLFSGVCFESLGGGACAGLLVEGCWPARTMSSRQWLSSSAARMFGFEATLQLAGPHWGGFAVGRFGPFPRCIPDVRGGDDLAQPMCNDVHPRQAMSTETVSGTAGPPVLSL